MVLGDGQVLMPGQGDATVVPGNGEFQGRIRISLGVGYRDETTLSIDALLKMADEAVYAAKRAGRNRVALGSPPRDKGKKSA